MPYKALETVQVQPSALRAARERTMARVEASLSRACPPVTDENNTLQSALEHHLGAGGQRLRARLCAETALLLDLSEPDAAALASCCELLHNASLVQDDLQDRSGTRRGRTAVWAGYGDDVAIGLSDVLISAAFASLAEASIPGSTAKLTQLAHAAVVETVTGQQADLAYREHAPRAITEYLDVARGKSGPLVALALELPLAANGLTGSLPRARQSANAFATAYQITDDVHDVETDRASPVEPGALNVVLLLERLGAKHPFDDAVYLARSYLTASRAAAAYLPSGSGTPLVEAASALSDVIRQTGHG